MNCRQMRENVYEYLEGSLSLSEKSETEKHLADCLSCQEFVETERHFAHSLSQRLQQSVQAVDLDAFTRRRMVHALQQKAELSQSRPYFFRWPRLAFPFAIGGLTLTTVFLLGYSLLNLKKIPSRLESSPNETAEASIHLSYPVTGYTFQKNGNVVVDALTIETLVADGRVTSE